MAEQTALVPPLTDWDRRLLRAVPAALDLSDPDWRSNAEWFSAWTIAERLLDPDVTGVAQALNGLRDRGLVVGTPPVSTRRAHRWQRTPKGDREASVVREERDQREPDGGEGSDGR